MNPKSAPLLSLENVTVRVGGETRLRNVSFELHSGQVTTIVGPNGGGKTTLLRAIVGDLRARSGHIRRAENLRIGYAPQKLSVDASMPLTTLRFVSLGGGDAKAAREALEQVGGAHLAQAQATELSGGEFQRALLARALLRKPNLFLLDEPTQGLDQAGAAELYRLIGRLQAQSAAAVLMVSHELHVVMAASDHVICLNGHVCCYGAPDAVERHPEYRRLFGAADQGALAIYRHKHDHTH